MQTQAFSTLQVKPLCFGSVASVVAVHWYIIFFGTLISQPFRKAATHHVSHNRLVRWSISSKCWGQDFQSDSFKGGAIFLRKLSPKNEQCLLSVEMQGSCFCFGHWVVMSVKGFRKLNDMTEPLGLGTTPRILLAQFSQVTRSSAAHLSTGRKRLLLQLLLSGQSSLANSIFVAFRPFFFLSLGPLKNK